MKNRWYWHIAKVIVFGLALWPFAAMLWGAVHGTLGPDPIETLHFRTGDWTLRFLLITLACTPLKLLFSWTFQMRFRRMFGLFAFFYATVHFLVYIVLDLSLSWEQVLEEVPKSPYVLVGLLAYTLLVPLAATSNRKMVQRLGRNWKKLHQLVYIIAILGLVHFFWLVKADLTEPLIYAVVLGVLFGVRIVNVCRKRRSRLARVTALRSFLPSKS